MRMLIQHLESIEAKMIGNKRQINKQPNRKPKRPQRRQPSGRTNNIPNRKGNPPDNKESSQGKHASGPNILDIIALAEEDGGVEACEDDGLFDCVCDHAVQGADVQGVGVCDGVLAGYDAHGHYHHG